MSNIEINEVKRKIQEEALDALEKNNYNGIVLLPTGVGKTWVLIEALKRLKKIENCNKIWYLCNSTLLRDVGFNEELKVWGLEELGDSIEKMCYQTAYKRANEEVDILLADEFDYSLSPEYIKVYLNNRFKHKILVSATLETDKLKLSENVEKIVYVKELQDAEDEGALNKSSYNFVNFLLTDKENEQYIRLNNNIEKAISDKEKVELQLLLLNDKSKADQLIKTISKLSKTLEYLVIKRKQFLNKLESSKIVCRKLMKTIYDKDRDCKILIFCELSEQADEVCKYSYHYNTNDDNFNKFKNNEISALAVCGKLNRGINVKNVNYVIFESCNRSKTQLIQRLGRGKRLAIDLNLNVYFLIPYFKQDGKIKPTKIRDWIYKAARDLNLKSINQIVLK